MSRKRWRSARDQQPRLPGRQQPGQSRVSGQSRWSPKLPPPPQQANRRPSWSSTRRRRIQPFLTCQRSQIRKLHRPYRSIRSAKLLGATQKGTPLSSPHSALQVRMPIGALFDPSVASPRTPTSLTAPNARCHSVLTASRPYHVHVVTLVSGPTTSLQIWSTTSSY